MNYFLSLILLSVTLLGQVNIEQYRTNQTDGKLEEKFYEYINVSTSLKRSTTSMYDIGLKYFKPILTGNYEGFLITKLNYGKNKGSVYINNSFYHFRLIALESESAYGIPEIYLQYESNEYALTKERYLAGVGLRYKFGDTISGTSVMNEWYRENDSSSRNNFWRISQYITFNFPINRYNKLSTTVYIQPSVADISNIRYYSESSFFSAINKFTTFKSTLSTRFYSDSIDFDSIEIFLDSGLEFKL